VALEKQMAECTSFKLPDFISSEEIIKKIKKIQQEITLLVFDLDETILSHKLYVYDRIIEGFNYKKLHKFTPKENQLIIEFLKYSGTDGVLSFIKNEFLQNLSIAEMIEVLRDPDLKINKKIERENTVEVLKDLMLAYEIVICTNGNKRQQENKIRYLNNLLERQIPTYYCSDTKPKPAPDCLITAIQGRDPAECLFIGDSETDSIAARLSETNFLYVSEIENYCMKQ
jgi:HAD superfamily hydrolase (TIGR01549 family)